jgi:E3 SUMO-protein ligase PIAS1
MISCSYFDDILLKCPESVEDVIVEADGQWHTSDNKFGSADWIATHPSKPDPAPVKERSPSKPLVKVTNGKDRARPSDAEVFILDSDDEDEGRVKRELSPSYDQPVPPGSQQRNGSSQISAVIDLTLDSDDEDPPRPTQKRKAIDAPSPTEQIWKKSRSSASISDPITDIHTLSAHRLKMYGPSDYRRFAQSRW